MALVAPNLTLAAPVVPVKPVPVITTELVPAAGPEVGLSDVTVGGNGRFVTDIGYDVSVMA